ncbi:MAG TPA: hypothetical protein VK177_19770 [Flavobacteriales bacterium]|nr:hypothetical protein [Flavobacteriales bacterium]
MCFTASKDKDISKINKGTGKDLGKVKGHTYFNKKQVEKIITWFEENGFKGS